MNAIFKKAKKIIVQILLSILFAIVVAIILRVFLFSSFKIPTPSMEPAVKPGDYVLVNKLIIGPRLFKNFRFLKGEKVETFRLPGIRKIRRNDVLVFNFPYSDGDKLSMDINVYYLKRCIAIAGDTFYIKNGFYKVSGCDDTLGNFNNQKILSNLTSGEISSGVYNCFPYNSNLHWNLKIFGPLYIPKSNDNLQIDTSNIHLYKRLIEYETDKTIKIQNDTIFLGKNVIKSYTFKMNYYMMAGDYVLDSRDSRYWGLLPEDHIVGKATRIWKSRDPESGKFRYNRLLIPVK